MDHFIHAVIIIIIIIIIIITTTTTTTTTTVIIIVIIILAGGIFTKFATQRTHPGDIQTQDSANIQNTRWPGDQDNK